MWRWLIPLAVACLVALGLVKASQQPSQGTIATITSSQRAAQPLGPSHPCGARAAGPGRYRHVVWFMLGSRSFGDVIGKFSKATYVNQLATRCGLATNYNAVTHPELPNVVASVAGTPAGLTRNRCAPCQTSQRSLFSQVGTWAVYAESMPSPCTTVDDPDQQYSARRNPATFFPGLRCRQRDLPLGTVDDGPLTHALATNSLPQLTVVVPNECDSMGFHRACGVSRAGDFVALGDLWLESWMNEVLSSRAYRSGTTAIFVTWADGSPAKPVDHDCVHAPIPSCHVAALVIAPSVKPGTKSGERFTHYSLLRTTEELLGISTYLGGAADAPSMRKAFGL
jgi:phosphatidylinositol-3-phosphatase